MWHDPAESKPLLTCHHTDTEEEEEEETDVEYKMSTASNATTAASTNTTSDANIELSSTRRTQRSSISRKLPGGARASGSVRFDAIASAGDDDDGDAITGTSTDTRSVLQQYGTTEDSLPLFAHSVHSAKKRGRAWLQRSKAVTLSKISNVGDGSDTNPLSPSSNTSSLPYQQTVINDDEENEEFLARRQAQKSSILSSLLHADPMKSSDHMVSIDDINTAEDMVADTDTDTVKGTNLSNISKAATFHAPMIKRMSTSRMSTGSAHSTPASSAPSSPRSVLSVQGQRPWTRLWHHLRFDRAYILDQVTDPVGEYRRVWLLIIFSFLLYNAIAVPLRLAFRDIWDHTNAIVALTCLDYTGDVFFVLDVGLYFYTPYIKHGILERGHVDIQRHYLRTWFLPDFLSSFPFDLLFIAKGIQFSQWWRLSRLLRFAKYDQYFSVWEQYSTRFPQLIRFSKLIVGMLLILHWLSCFWFSCGYWYGFGTTPWLPSDDIVGTSLDSQYVFAFWWATNIVTQVGGDPGLPSTDAERLFNLLIAFLSVFVVAVVIGNVNELVSELNADEGRLRERLQTLNYFMQTRRLPDELQSRIRSYYLKIWARRGGIDDASIMEELPTSLRTEISLVLNQDILGKVPIFANSSTGFIHSLVGHLKLQTYGPKEVIVREGDIGSEMYFVSRGQVVVIVSGKVVGTINDGGFFGEIAVLQEQSKRTASIQAINYCDLFVLTHEDMMTVFKSFPAEKQIILHVADTRRAKDLLRKVLSDDRLLAREKLGGLKDATLVATLIELFKPIAMGAGAQVQHNHAEGSQAVSDDEGDNDEDGQQLSPRSRRLRSRQSAIRQTNSALLQDSGLYEGPNGELIDLEDYGLVFAPHQPADAIYFIGKGSVDIYAHPGIVSPTDGDGDRDSVNNDSDEPRLVCRLTEGSFFGAIADGNYQISAVIPFDQHCDTIIFALTVDDLPKIQDHYECITDPQERKRVQQCLTMLLQRLQREEDYRRSLIPLPQPVSRSSSIAKLASQPPTPKTLHQLIRSASIKARHSRHVSLDDEKQQSDPTSNNSSNEQPIITISEPSEQVKQLDESKYDEKLSTSNSSTTSSLPTVEAMPVHSAEQSRHPSPPRSLLDTGSGQRGLPLTVSDPLTRSTSEAGSHDHERRRSWTYLRDDADQARSRRSHSFLIDAPVIETARARLTPEPSSGGSGGSRRHSHTSTPFAFLSKLGVRGDLGTSPPSPSPGNRDFSSPGSPSLSPTVTQRRASAAPLSINTRAHDTTTGVSPALSPTHHHHHHSHSQFLHGPEPLSPLTPSRSPRSSMIRPTSPAAGHSPTPLSSNAQRLAYLEKSLNSLNNEDLLLLANKATLKLYARLHNTME